MANLRASFYRAPFSTIQQTYTLDMRVPELVKRTRVGRKIKRKYYAVAPYYIHCMFRCFSTSTGYLQTSFTLDRIQLSVGKQSDFVLPFSDKKNLGFLIQPYLGKANSWSGITNSGNYNLEINAPDLVVSDYFTIVMNGRATSATIGVDLVMDLYYDLEEVSDREYFRLQKIYQ